MRAIAFCLVGLSACFGIPTYQDGVLECDDGQCPPDMECRTDNRCYHIGGQGGQVDAPLVTVDARPNDGPTFDAPLSPFDAPPSLFDAPPVCTVGAHRCMGGNLEVCLSGQWSPALPSCADQGMQCFDPSPTGGTDAYCGTCLKGSQRCTSTSPPKRQNCPAATGVWTDAETCDATLGCYDLDGPDAPQAYCGVCTNGDKRCNGGLQTCAQGQWSAPENCAATSGWSCFDPAPTGGSDAYCGLCLKNAIVCNGDNRDQCNAQGTAFVNLQMCTWGCMTSGCCGTPSCSGTLCGPGPANACGRRMDCGDCNGNPTKCCGGTICCSPISCCVGPGQCGPCS